MAIIQSPLHTWRAASPSTLNKFKVRHSPGTTVPDSGIYRCTHCRYEEIVAVKGKTFPPCAAPACQHMHTHGLVRWRLIALPNHRRLFQSAVSYVVRYWR